MSTNLMTMALLGGLAAACGSSPKSDNGASTDTASDQNGPGSGDAAVLRCATGEHHYTVAPGSFVTWMVVKTDGSPVVGVNKAAGGVETKGDQPLANVTMGLVFDDMASNYTGHELRDSRLTHYFFQGDSGHLLRFTLTKASPDNGKMTLPDVGFSTGLTLSGTLDVAGVKANVDVPVLLSTRPNGGLHVTEALQGVTYDIRSQLGAGGPLDTLLALIGAHIKEQVMLRFSLDLTDSCS